MYKEFYFLSYFRREPISAIDVKKIDDIKNYIKEIKKDKIIIVISHEDYWKTLADEIITIEDYFN